MSIQLSLSKKLDAQPVLQYGMSGWMAATLYDIIVPIKLFKKKSYSYYKYSDIYTATGGCKQRRHDDEESSNIMNQAPIIISSSYIALSAYEPLQ